MITKIDVDRHLSSSSGKMPLSNIGKGDSQSRTSDYKPAYEAVTSSNTPLYVTMVIVCLLALNTLSVYQVLKLEGRIQRLEDDFAVSCSTKSVVDGSNPMTSSTANSATPPNNDIRSPPPQMNKMAPALPLLTSAGRNNHPHRSGSTGSGFENDDVDAEEDGSGDLYFGFDDGRVDATSASDDVIDGTGDEPWASVASAERQNISRPLADTDNSGDEYESIGIAGNTENWMDVLMLFEDRLDDLMFGNSEEGLEETPIDNIGPGKSRPRRSVDERLFNDDAEVDRMMADDTSLGDGTEGTAGRNTRHRHRHRIGGDQPRRSEQVRADGDGSRSRPSSQQREPQQPASSDDVMTMTDTVRTNRETSLRNRTRQERPFKDVQKKSRHSGASSVGAAQTLGIKVAHFVAPRDRNHYVSDSDPPVTFPFWKVDTWTSALDSQNQFYELRDGMVTVMESGVYMVYAQMMYHDTSGRWAFGIYVDNSERIKCMNSEQLNRQHGTDILTGGSDTVHSVYQHCYTSGLLRLRRYDKVSLRCLYGSKSIILQPSFTFWGLIKLVPLGDQ